MTAITEEYACPLTGCRPDPTARPVRRGVARPVKPRGSKRTAPATYHAEAFGHTLDAGKGTLGWFIDCPAFPQLAAEHDGCDDLCACLDEFEALAQAHPAKKRGAA